MINPFAYFDSLSICDKLAQVHDTVFEIEIHLFAYLACLLSIYRKEPVAAWGYQFAVTDRAYPYSSDISLSLTTLVTMGHLKTAEGAFSLSTRGNSEVSQLGQLRQNRRREIYIDGACSSALALPIGAIHSALAQELQLKSALKLSQSRLLLSNLGLSLLHEQFAALSSVVGADVNDLMVPAVVWLTYLSSIQAMNEDNEDYVS